MIPGSKDINLWFRNPKGKRLCLQEEMERESIVIHEFGQRAWQRLTFPFPFVHHQSHDRKVEQLLTLEPGIILQVIKPFQREVLHVCKLVTVTVEL